MAFARPTSGAGVLLREDGLSRHAAGQGGGPVAMESDPVAGGWRGLDAR